MSQDRDPKTPQDQAPQSSPEATKTKTTDQPSTTDAKNQNPTDAQATKTQPTTAKSEAPQPTPKSQKNQSKKTPKSGTETTEKPLKEVFILARPFVAFGRYLRDSRMELRQVRWPNRTNAWKLVLAVFIYCAIFLGFIILLDTFFTFIFNLLLGVH